MTFLIRWNGEKIKEISKTKTIVRKTIYKKKTRDALFWYRLNGIYHIKEKMNALRKDIE